MSVAATVFLLALLSAPVAPLSAPSPVIPDPGMWTFDNLPLEHLKKTYGFEPGQAWIDHLRLASVRVSSGGSGSFVSPRGLVLTNHHVALEFINGLSTPERDLAKEGFHARTQEEELACPGADIRQVRKILDVTDRVEAKAEEAGSPEMALMAREQAQQEIQKELASEWGLEVEMVSLYGGARFHAYGYKVWTDIRLVFAPEMRAAYFGGDLDNFCYPRYCLDAAFLRAYEDGVPADTSEAYFKWSKAGPSKDELVFVSGHPGSTARLWPVDRLRHERDVYNPAILTLLKNREAVLTAYAARSEEARIKVLDELFGVRNSLKAYEGQQGGLLDSGLWSRKEKEQAAFLETAGDDKDVKAALETYARTRTMRDESFAPLVFLRLDGDLGTLARQVIRLGLILKQPSDERPETHRGEALEEIKQKIIAASFDAPLEEARLRSNFESAAEMLGKDHDYVKVALAGGNAATTAADAVRNSVLASEGGRRSLLEGGAEAILESDDRLLRLARIVETQSGPARALWVQAESQEAQAAAQLARARFRIYGARAYPDATFTLRLAYGVCKGYELGTTRVPWTTTLFGLFDRAASMGNEDPFDLPESWAKACERLDLSTPYNFVSTCDITGGNSGSPVVNKDLEIVGLIFDGNIQSLPARYLYLDDVSRAVSVHSEGIKHALDRVYRAYGLLAELEVQ
jgi:hypothetical protein